MQPTLLALAAAIAVWQLGSTLLLLALALLLSAAFAPAVGWLEAHRVPRLLGTLLCLLLAAASLAGTIAYLIPLILRQAAQLADRLPALGQGLTSMETRWAAWRDEYGFLPRFKELADLAQSQLAALSRRTVAAGGRLLLLAVQVATVLLVAFFLLKDGRALLDQVLSPIGEPRRSGLQRILRRVGQQLGRFVLGRLLVMIAVGLLTGVGLALIGMPYPAFLGVLAGLLDIVPFFGPMVAAVPGLLVASGQSFWMVLGALVIYVAVQQLESLLLSPLLIGRAVGLHPFWVIIAIIAGAEAMGLVGMILAVPIASTVQIVIRELRHRGEQTEVAAARRADPLPVAEE